MPIISPLNLCLVGSILDALQLRPDRPLFAAFEILKKMSIVEAVKNEPSDVQNISNLARPRS